MSAPIKAMAAKAPKADVTPYEYSPKPLAPGDIEMEVSHCGVCASDVHQIDNDWGMLSAERYPLVPGHEAVGKVVKVGSDVTRVAVGDVVGLGAQCGACLDCDECAAGRDNLCPKREFTYVASYTADDGKVYPHHGGFGQRIITPASFVFRIPAGYPHSKAGPLMCAGITVYAPLRKWGVESGERKRVGILGVGGLGHLAVQFAAKMGAEVTGLTHSPSKAELCKQMGAAHVLDTGDQDALKAAAGSLDFILCTVSHDIDFTPYYELLASNGVLCFVGLPTKPLQLSIGTLAFQQRIVTGSVVGNRDDLQKMLDFAATHDVQPITEDFALKDAQQAIQKVRDNTIRFRAVLDCSKFD